MEFGGEAWTSLEGPPQAEALYTRGGGEAWVTAPDGVWLHTGQGWERKHAHRPLGAALHPEGGLLVAIEGGEVIHLRGDGQTTSLGAPPALFRDSSVPIVERHEPLATRKSSPSRFQSHLHHQLTSAARSPLGHALLHPRTARIRLPPS